MTGALIIACVTLLTWLILRFFERGERRGEKNENGNGNGATEAEEKESGESGEECCGAHSYCVKLLPRPEKPIYFEDEELDRFAGREADDYSEEETEEFRDILLTLRPEESPEWAQSLNMRGINVPSGLIEELNLLISEELSHRN